MYAENKKLETTLATIDATTLQNQKLLKQIEEENLEKRETLVKIEETLKIARKESDENQEVLRQLRNSQEEYNRNSSYLDFLANQAKSLIMILRSETIKHVQLKGTDITLADVNDKVTLPVKISAVSEGFETLFKSMNNHLFIIASRTRCFCSNTRVS